VGATAVARGGGRMASVTLSARSEAETTARCAAALIDLWGLDRPGCHLPETVIAPQPYLDALTALDMQVTHAPPRR